MKSAQSSQQCSFLKGHFFIKILYTKFHIRCKILTMIEHKILFIIDEVELKYFEFNKLVTNFWLIVEFLKRDYEVFITVKNSLYLEGKNPMGLVFNTNFDGVELKKSENKQKMPLENFNVIFYRPDPPVDIDYINSSYILSFVNKEKTLIINSPNAIRDKNEKLYVNEFPSIAPKNVVSADASIIKEFLNNEGEIIIKPLNRCFSSGVFYLNKVDKNINSIINTATNNGTTTVMVQRFLPAISKGDKRLIFINGKIMDYSVLKIGTDDFKFNAHTDDNFHIGEITEKDRQIEDIVKEKFIKDGVYMAGLDVIDGSVIEINITSPCFFIKEINAFFNIEFEKIIVDELEKLIKF